MSTAQRMFQKRVRHTITDASYKTTTYTETVPLTDEEIDDARRSHANRLASIEPKRVRKLERVGKSVLSAKAEPPKKMAKHIVRIYYKSQGDELLCVDSEPLTDQAADELYAHALKFAVNAVKFSADKPPHMQPGARLVVLPSQVKEDTATEESACA